MSIDSFEKYVQPNVAAVYRGKLRLYRPRDLEAWADKNLESPKVAA